jgi:transcriptional regulator with XRE-family HTH domain
MAAILQPIVAVCQSLIVTEQSVKMQFMVAISREEEKQGFSRRLNAACEFREIKLRGRPAYLAKQMGVSPQGARKWLEAYSIPDQTNIGRLAVLLQVNAEWLQVGPGDTVIPANTDEVAQKLAFIWAALSEDDKKTILRLASGLATLPNQNDKPKPILEPPPPSDPVSE